MKKLHILIILLLIFAIPLIIYLIDYFNIFSLLGLTNNINTDIWLSSIYTYIAAIIGAISLAAITQYQIRKTFDFERKINDETKRIENAPYIEYKFDIAKSISTDCIIIDNSKMNHDNIEENCNEVILTAKLENIGLGHAKNFTFGVETPIDRIYHQKDILKQGSSTNDEVTILFDKKEMEEEKYEQHKRYYSLKYYTYYQDMLNNAYKQIVDLKIELSFVRENGSVHYMQIIDSININEPELIKELPRFKSSHLIELIDIPIKK